MIDMEFFYKKEWLPILVSHEKDLVFNEFTRQDAFEIGTRIVRLAKEKYKGNAAVCIYEDDMQIFSHKMQGTNLGNDIWIFRKRNTGKALGMSTMRALLEIESGNINICWDSRKEAFVVCGGYYPVHIKNKSSYVHIIVSGLEHYYDHQIIIDAVSEHLNIQVPSIAL